MSFTQDLGSISNLWELVRELRERVEKLEAEREMPAKAMAYQPDEGAPAMTPAYTMDTRYDFRALAAKPVPRLTEDEVREVIAECRAVVNCLSPIPAEVTERERGRAEAYASIGRKLEALLAHRTAKPASAE